MDSSDISRGSPNLIMSSTPSSGPRSGVNPSSTTPPRSCLLRTCGNDSSGRHRTDHRSAGQLRQHPTHEGALPGLPGRTGLHDRRDDRRNRPTRCRPATAHLQLPAAGRLRCARARAGLRRVCRRRHDDRPGLGAVSPLATAGHGGDGRDRRPRPHRLPQASAGQDPEIASTPTESSTATGGPCS